MLVTCAVCGATARSEDFARPPEWSDEVKDVFFDDARDALSGEPPTAARANGIPRGPDQSERITNEVWGALISADALEATVKATVIRLAGSVRQPARFKAGLHNDCRRDLTLLGTLFEVIAVYPGEVRWKSAAPQVSQMCLHSAQVCAEGSAQSLAQVNGTLATLGELMRGEAGDIDSPVHEALIPDFAPLMQVMEFVGDEELPSEIGKPTQFRRGAQAVAEKAQLLAALSQVIRGEAYGYADDEIYQAHADQLRDAALDLIRAATAEDYARAVQAATALQNSCAKCHADYRG